MKGLKCKKILSDMKIKGQQYINTIFDISTRCILNCYKNTLANTKIHCYSPHSIVVSLAYYQTSNLTWTLKKRINFHKIRKPGTTLLGLLRNSFHFCPRKAFVYFLLFMKVINIAYERQRKVNKDTMWLFVGKHTQEKFGPSNLRHFRNFLTL